MITPPSVLADCYLQGTNEETHGIADSLISVLAVRAGEIVEDILAHRGTDPVLASASVNGHSDPALSDPALSDPALPDTAAAAAAT